MRSYRAEVWSPAMARKRVNIKPIINDVLNRYPDLNVCRGHILAGYALLRATVEGGGKIMLCGNGGSAADGSHIAGELLKSLCKERKLPARELKMLGPKNKDLAEKLEGAIPAISLSDQGVIQSAWANDVDADYIYAQLTWALGQPGDLLWGISTSGNSENVIHALRAARAKKIRALGLIGRDGGKMKPLCDVAILAPGRNTQEIQERHLPIYHALCMMLEETFF